MAGIDGDGNVVVYWWAPGLEVWNITNLSDEIDGDAPAGNLSGFASSSGTINLVGLAADGDVIRYHWDASGDQIWRGDDLTNPTEYRV